MANDNVYEYVCVRFKWLTWFVSAASRSFLFLSVLLFRRTLQITTPHSPQT